MKRFAITALAVFYAILIVGATAERSSTWAAREADALARPSSEPHVPVMGKDLPTETYVSQKKRVETEFAMELPREAVLAPITSGSRVALVPMEFHSTLCGHPSASRSPPAHS